MRPVILSLLTAASLVHADQRGGIEHDVAPYEPDSHTLHLWHLDESAPPFRNAADRAFPLRGLHNGAMAGQASIATLGRCISFLPTTEGSTTDGSPKDPILTLQRNPRDELRRSASPSFRYSGDDGAFTFEALVRFSELPMEGPGTDACILSINGGDGRQVFVMRIRKDGTFLFAPLRDSGANGGAIAEIPLTGPNAINAQSWFHLAASYNGKPNILHNIKLYWTRLDSGTKEAIRIGSGTLTDDMDGSAGDLLIGNNALPVFEREWRESQAFPGLIDEVRISSVARNPRDFILTPPEDRISPEQAALQASLPRPGGLPLHLSNLFVDGEPVPLPQTPEEGIQLGAGLHRLDIDFTYPTEQGNEMADLRCRLEGLDERWVATAKGMTLTCQVRDRSNQTISETTFNAVGTSSGWRNSLEESEFTTRAEPYYIPAEGRSVYIAINSGSDDTTGSYALDDLEMRLPGPNGASLWSNSDFSKGSDLESPGGTPNRWIRRNDDGRITWVFKKLDNVSLVLADGDQSQSGEWASLQEFDSGLFAGRTVVLSWKEAYNINAGNFHRATYMNVPSGKYNFRAIGLITNDSGISTASLSLPIRIPPPIWERPWFLPLVAAGGVALLSLAIYQNHRRRNRRRLRELRFQNELERDRARIARDMHDDLGTRISVLNLNGSIALRDIDANPENSKRHLGKLTAAARDFVVAMDDLVWAVDPTYDSLDQFASHLTRMTEEIFRDSDIRCRLDIPTVLPSHPLDSGTRHQLALAVKEALHNVLRHAGPCEASLKLRLVDSDIVIEIQDSGTGFVKDPQSARHGLDNLRQRLAALGGTCEVSSSLGEGTHIRFICPITTRTDSPNP